MFDVVSKRHVWRPCEKDNCLCRDVIYRVRGMLVVLLLFVIGVAAHAQDAANPVISAGTITQLQPAVQIDYATVENAGSLESGWLRVSDDGTYIVTVNRANDMLLWDTITGDLLDVYAIPGADGTNTNMLDVAWHPDGASVHSLHTDGATYSVAAYDVASGEVQIISTLTADDRPVRVWPDADPARTWIEVMPLDSSVVPYVMQLDVVTGRVMQQLDSAPEADPISDARIGRMPAPLAVTASVDGLAQLWNLESGEQLSAVQVDSMPMFGHMNGASGRVLAWRDPMSEQLQLLDFTTGENTLIAPLNGDYLQALLITPSEDVIVGVNVNAEPVVVAWRTVDGERLSLGEYRNCTRTPDMVQISTDGTTLVIGCDTGLDVWRVQAD